VFAALNRPAISSADSTGPSPARRLRLIALGGPSLPLITRIPVAAAPPTLPQDDKAVERSEHHGASHRLAMVCAGDKALASGEQPAPVPTNRRARGCARSPCPLAHGNDLGRARPEATRACLRVSKADGPSVDPMFVAAELAGRDLGSTRSLRPSRALVVQRVGRCRRARQRRDGLTIDQPPVRRISPATTALQHKHCQMPLR